MHNFRKLIVFLMLLFIGFSVDAFAQKKQDISILSWNIQHLGRTKSEESLRFIANIIKDYDVIAIQEVVAKTGGVKAVSDLINILNEIDQPTEWNGVVSQITSGDNAQENERYAFIWNESKIKKVGQAWLHQTYHEEIVREPYMGTFAYETDTFTLVNFHAVPKKKNPEREIKFFKFMPNEFPDLNLIFVGDFNTSSKNDVFNPLKRMGYMPALVGQKTTLRMQCINNDCMASEYDNIFYNKHKIRRKKAGVIHYYRSFPDVKTARNQISDHAPVFLRFTIK